MNQVECRVASFEIECEGFGIGKIRFAELPLGNPQPIRGPRSLPASGRDNESSSRNRADAERDVRQCSRWLRQSRQSSMELQILLGQHSQSQVPTVCVFCSRLTSNPSALASSTSRLIDRLVHPRRSRKDPKIFPGRVADQRMRVIRRERNDLVVSPHLRNEGKECRSETNLENRIRLSVCLQCAPHPLPRSGRRFPAGNDSAPRSFRLAATCISL